MICFSPCLVCEIHVWQVAHSFQCCSLFGQLGSDEERSQGCLHPGPAERGGHSEGAAVLGHRHAFGCQRHAHSITEGLYQFHYHQPYLNIASDPHPCEHLLFFYFTHSGEYTAASYCGFKLYTLYD